VRPRGALQSLVAILSPLTLPATLAWAQAAPTPRLAGRPALVAEPARSRWSWSFLLWLVIIALASSSMTFGAGADREPVTQELRPNLTRSCADRLSDLTACPKVIELDANANDDQHRKNDHDHRDRLAPPPAPPRQVAGRRRLCHARVAGSVSGDRSDKRLKCPSWSHVGTSSRKGLPPE